MKGEFVSATDSAALAAKAAGVESVPNFPAPLSVEITRKLSAVHQCDIFEVPSVSDAFSAAIGCSASGKRTLVPTSSPLAYEVFSAPFMRLPFVVVNVSRSQHNIRSDHTAAMALRDAGYLMFFPEGNQELHDTIISAYRICEDSKVLLPAIVNIDGVPNFSEVIQPVKEVGNFLSKLSPRLSAKKPPLDMYSDSYAEQKLQMSKAMDNVNEVMKKAGEKWKQKFHRSYESVEKFMTDDADIVIVIMGYHSPTAKAAVKKMRAAGRKVGVLRIRLFRPWPKDLISNGLANAKKVIAFDQAVSVGVGGILSAHIRRPCSSLICLGKYPNEKDFIDAVSRVEKSEKDLKLWL